MSQPEDKGDATQAQMGHPRAIILPPSRRVSTTKLVVLLILSSILSSALSPLMENGLRRAAEIYLGLPPNAGDAFHYQDHYDSNSQAPPPFHSTQQTNKPVAQQQPSVPLAKKAKTTSKDDFQCEHSYRTFVIRRDPLVVYLEDFLRPGEAEHMISIATPKMERSRVLGDEGYSQDCTSSTGYLTRGADHVVKCIETRASLFSNISVDATEPLQVALYAKGQEFRPHYDFLRREDLKADYWSRWGQRYVSFLIYLSEPEGGGSTIFSQLGLSFKPKKNDAIFWYNVDINEKEDMRTLHGDTIVKDGEKYVVSIWQRKMLPGLEPFIQKDEDTKQPPNPPTPPEKKVEDKNEVEDDDEDYESYRDDDDDDDDDE